MSERRFGGTLQVVLLTFLTTALVAIVALQLGLLDGLVRERILTDGAPSNPVPLPSIGAAAVDREEAADGSDEDSPFLSPLPILIEAQLTPEQRNLDLEEALFQSALPIVRDRAQNDFREWRQLWFGVPTRQYPNDMLMYQELLWLIRPDVIIETGTWYGGLTLFLSTVLDAVNPEARIISVDIEKKLWEQVSAREDGLQRFKERVTFIHGSSTAAATIEQMRALIAEDDKVLVILDSLHEKHHVLEELRLLSDFVSPESYIVCTDTHLDGTHWIDGPGGPFAAMREFLAEDDRFEVDRSLDRYMISANISGYLRRVR